MDEFDFIVAGVEVIVNMSCDSEVVLVFQLFFIVPYLQLSTIDHMESEMECPRSGHYS